jgi:hypothetical protein
MCAYFRAEPLPEQQAELFHGRFEHWPVEEWDDIWRVITERPWNYGLPQYGHFAEIRRDRIAARSSREERERRALEKQDPNNPEIARIFAMMRAELNRVNRIDFAN